MKKLLLLTVLSLPIIESVSGQVKTKTLKKVAELKMPKTADDDMPGRRGACVVWHPGQKKYYASMAGNFLYPLAVFDAAGKRLSGEEDSAMADVRGLWFNPDAKRIEGNSYADGGWFFYKLDEKGMAYASEILFEGRNQPTEQCVGAYIPSDKKIMFLSGSQVYYYETSDGSAAGDQLILHWGRTEKEGAAEDEEPTVSPSNYNITSIVFTNLPSAEIGALNTNSKQIELYNKKNGFLTQVLKLPDEAIVETNFNFALANGIYWLFDMDNRVWIGYK